MSDVAIGWLFAVVSGSLLIGAQVFYWLDARAIRRATSSSKPPGPPLPAIADTQKPTP